MNLTSKRVLACLTAVMGLSLVASADTFEDAFEVNDTWQTYNAQGSQILTNAYPGMPLVDYKTEYGAYTGVGFASTNGVWSADGADASTIIAGTYDFTATSKPAVTNTLSDQYVQLNTEGCTVTRTLGATLADGGDAYYLDTMIKFAPSEETPTISGTLYKIALFVNASSNLVIRSLEGSATGASSTTSDAVFTQVIDPEKWYRLTIESKYSTGWQLPVFRVRINGTVISDATKANCVSDSPSDAGWNGEWFLPVAPDASLTSVSFQGTGALDDLLFTTTAPTFSAPTIIQLTLAYDDAILDVYNGETLLTPSTAVDSGAAIKVVAKDWYEVTGVTPDSNTAVADIAAKNAAGTALAGIGAGSFAANVTFTGTATAAGTITIAAAKYAAGDTAFGTFTANASKLATWALANGLSIADTTANAATYFDKYLLNIAPGTATPSLVITSIVTDDAAGTMTIKVAASTDAVDFTTINGTLEAYSSSTLASWGDAYTADIVITPAAKEVTYVIPYTKGAFFKAVIK